MKRSFGLLCADTSAVVKVLPIAAVDCSLALYLSMRDCSLSDCKKQEVREAKIG